MCRLCTPSHTTTWKAKERRPHALRARRDYGGHRARPHDERQRQEEAAPRHAGEQGACGVLLFWLVRLIPFVSFPFLPSFFPSHLPLPVHIMPSPFARPVKSQGPLANAHPRTAFYQWSGNGPP
ncbi:hypothetical protein FIBSPDRAFT_465891 [Athelia psychrophila]|uniref:Uncharacterized protein n=1 Tax=Athelia psychrophila TaxID=1759441 RepID=A0A166LJ66_9AGAM|nr:hypothetical protein FIBSPDRAFT_465891 [Fibularhizoctonia sp. CBS 109695]